LNRLFQDGNPVLQFRQGGLVIHPAEKIALGIGIPIHYLSEPESSTRTTAEAAGTPTFKTFENYQASFFNIIRDVLVTACAVRRGVDSRILEHPEFTVSGQDITERDNASLALAGQRVVSALAPLYNAKLIPADELLRLVYRFIAESLQPGAPASPGFIPINARGMPKAPREAEEGENG
jgi:hypothetical protein